MLKAKGIRKFFGELEVLKGVDFEVAKAEVVSIVGASGAGKTTLLQILGTLSRPDEGKLIFNDTIINELPEKQMANFRNLNLGFVFQFHHLLPEFNALENVCIPGFIANKNKTEVENRAKELLGYLKLDHRFNHKPAEMSGGEQQRVAIARSLINNPEIILADEPSGNLDTKHKEELHELLFELRNKFNQTFVIVTHDNSLADMCDRKLVMADGLFV